MWMFIIIMFLDFSLQCLAVNLDKYIDCLHITFFDHQLGEHLYFGGDQVIRHHETKKTARLTRLLHFSVIRSQKLKHFYSLLYDLSVVFFLTFVRRLKTLIQTKEMDKQESASIKYMTWKKGVCLFRNDYIEVFLRDSEMKMLFLSMLEDFFFKAVTETGCQELGWFNSRSLTSSFVDPYLLDCINTQHIWVILGQK